MRGTKWGTIEDYITPSGGEKSIEDSIKSSVVAARRCTNTGILEKPIEVVFSAGYDEQKVSVKKPIRIMVETDINNIVQQGRLDLVWGPMWIWSQM